LAHYTTQLRSIVESGIDVFDFDYPIFDESYKPILEKKIIDTYYFREIGFETFAQFKHFLRTKLSIIMPFYNDRYLALNVFKTYDPYINKDLTTTENRTVNSESTGSSEGSATNRDIFSDTPQAKLQDLDYATNLSDGETSSTSTGTSNGNSTEDYVQTITGFDGMKYASEVYEGVIQTIENLDLLIINELNELFMSVY
jgi:hypothetical protein